MSVIDKIKLDGTTYDVGKTPDTTLAVSGSPADAATVGTELDKKVDKVTGKGLSTEDFTTAEKTKLAGIAEGATKISIDNTLTQSGQAADAKATGDKIAELKEDLDENVSDLKSAITDSFTFVAGEKKYVFSEKLTISGNTVYAPGLITTDYIAIPAGTTVTFYQGVYTENLVFCVYNSEKTFVDWYSSANESRELTLPTNTVYVRMTYKSGYNGRIENSTSYTLYYEAFSTSDGGIVSTIQDEIDNNKANLLGMIGEIFTPKFTAGKKLTRTGILVDDENYCVSDVVDVSKVSSRIVFYSGTGLETLVIAIYNNQMEFVDWYGISNTGYRELTKSDFKGGTLARFTFVPTYDARIVADGVILYEKLKNAHEPNNYYSAYIASKASRINTLLVDCAATGDAFVFVTDQHWELNQKQSPALIYALNKRCHFAKVFCGGDTGDNPSEEYCNAMREYYPHKIYHVAGNHDWFSGSGDLIYYYMDAYNDEQIGNPQKHWYYVDNPQKKIRYIILNRFRYADETWINDYSTQEQVDWLQDDALDISAGWSVIVFTHWIRGSGASDGLNIRQILDTAKSNGKDIIAIICGHSHYDALWNTEGGIPIIVTTCDKNGPWISSGTDMEPWLTSQRSDGTVNEQAFDFCIIDRVNHKIDAVRIGAKAMKNYAEETSESFASTNLLEERIVHSEPVTVSTTATITKSISGTVTWETSDSTVATVSDGVVTKVSAGSCVVSATNEDGLYEAWIIIT